MSRPRSGLLLASLAFVAALLADVRAGTGQASPALRAPQASSVVFAPSSECLACHNNLVSPAGEDVSIGASWRGTMMANAARDPYVHASVRRETVDHPARAADIEDECASCHLPAAKQVAHAEGGKARVFEHISNSAAGNASPLDDLAMDGVSCTICHQISPDRLGTPESFNGNFVVAAPNASGRRRAFGGKDPDTGRRRIMHSVTGFEQEQAPHVRESALCATCHTLITEALGPDGQVIGSLPEQMNFQEWQHSAFDEEGRSCQSCHMPAVAGPVRISSVLGDDRESLARHTFLGGNAFMLRLMNRFRTELGITATPNELEATARETVRQLESQTASLTIERPVLASGTLTMDVEVKNLTGHKFPTGYPSRRTWLQVTVRDSAGRAVFESGRLADTGLIVGNAGDEAAGAFEPHYAEVTRPDQVQIYESIMGTPAGTATTGLLQATRYLKDNRLLPRGFDKRTASSDIAVVGEAAADADFTGDGDRVRYRVPVSAAGPVTVEVELRYQSIGYRWAQNLASYETTETSQFVGYYNALAASSSVVVGSVTRRVGP